MGWDREKEKNAGKKMTIGSAVFGLVFSIFWCIMAVSMGAWFMLFFGVPFVGMMVYRLYVLCQLAKEDRKPEKEQEPWERPEIPQQPRQEKSAGNGFCPYCGGSVEAGFTFCPKCGRRLPE